MFKTLHWQGYGDRQRSETFETSGLNWLLVGNNGFLLLLVEGPMLPLLSMPISLRGTSYFFFSFLFFFVHVLVKYSFFFFLALLWFSCLFFGLDVMLCLFAEKMWDFDFGYLCFCALGTCIWFEKTLCNFKWTHFMVKIKYQNENE